MERLRNSALPSTPILFFVRNYFTDHRNICDVYVPLKPAGTKHKATKSDNEKQQKQNTHQNQSPKAFN